MAKCNRCKKFILFSSASGFCKSCDELNAREAEEQRRKATEEERQRKAEEERRRKEEEERQRKAEEEHRRKEEEERRRKEEEERRRKEEEAQRKLANRKNEAGYLKTKHTSLVFPCRYTTIVDANTPGNVMGNIIVDVNGYYWRFAEPPKPTRLDIRKISGNQFDNLELEDALYENAKCYYQIIIHARFINPPFTFVNDQGAKFLIMQYYYNNGQERIPLYSCISYFSNFEYDISVEPNRRGSFKEDEDLKLIKSVLNTVRADNGSTGSSSPWGRRPY